MTKAVFNLNHFPCTHIPFWVHSLIYQTSEKIFMIHKKNEDQGAQYTAQFLDALPHKPLKSTWLFPSMISLRRFKTVLRLLNWTAVRGSWPPRGGSAFLRLSAKEGRVITLIPWHIHIYTTTWNPTGERNVCINRHFTKLQCASFLTLMLLSSKMRMSDSLLWHFKCYFLSVYKNPFKFWGLQHLLQKQYLVYYINLVISFLENCEALL